MTKHCSIAGCSRLSRKRGWCDAHYWRWRKHGDPLAGRTPKGEPERFYREVVLTDTRGPDDPCLIWPYARKHGYAVVCSQSVSRLVCEEKHGPPPTPDHEAAHNCGKGHLACVTGGHLAWKTHAENVADTIIHGTHNRGERCGAAKLTSQQVSQIRSIGRARLQADLAREFRVSQTTISRIINQERWKYE